MGRYAGGEGPAAERGRADESFVVTLLSPKKAADILARVAPPASVLNLRAARRWGTDSRKYRLYTVFGVNWEMVFQAPVLLALLSGFDSPAVLVLLSLASAFVFAGVHKGRSGKARLVLVSLGILLAGALCAPALLLPAGLPAFALGVLLNAGLHSAYNLALLKGRLPRWASLFEGEKPVLSTSQRRSSGGDPSVKAEILPEMLFGGPAGPVRFDAARWDVSLSRLRDEALEKRRTASAGRRAVTAALGLPPAETPEDLVAEAYRRTAALHSRGGSLTDRTATPDAHMPRGLPGDVGRTDMELLAEFVLDVEEEFLGRRASRPSSASSTSAHPSGASFDRLFRLGAESYNGWVRERTGLAFADEALSRSWTSASRPAQETDLSSAAALVVEMSPAMVSDQMELSGTEITALEMLGGLADRIGSSEPAPKIVLLLHDPEGKTLGLSEAALRSRLENRLPEPQRERFRRNRSAVELTRTRQEWIRAGKIRVSRVLNSFNLSAADIYALDGGHWDLSGAEKTVRLILLLAGGLVRDLPARIGEEIRFIRLLNIQA
jgi:hypothetical protein